MSFGPAGPGFSSGSWVVVHSYCFTDGGSSVWDLTGQHRSQRSLFQNTLVLTGSRFLTICKNGGWDFQYNFPFWKALGNLWIATKEVHLYFRRKLLEIVCTTCRGIFVTAVFKVLFVSSCLNIMRLSVFLYCIILPFDLIRMSYNVRTAKSVFFVIYDQHVTNFLYC